MAVAKILHIEALDQGMEYYYQPIYDLRLERVTKAEILFRLRDTEGTFLDTETVMQVAERLGAIAELDLMAFRHACHVQSHFRAVGIECLNVNLSPTTLSPEFPQVLCDILSETGAEADGLCIELTEGTKLKDEVGMHAVLESLRGLGLQIAIDDFGKGYSSLQRMLNIPFDVLKLDKGLVQGMAQRKLTSPLLRHVFELAEHQRFLVVAEGVETEDQVRQLKELGCQYIQGYYISPPVSEGGFFQLLHPVAVAKAQG